MDQEDSTFEGEYKRYERENERKNENWKMLPIGNRNRHRSVTSGQPLGLPRAYFTGVSMVDMNLIW